MIDSFMGLFSTANRLRWRDTVVMRCILLILVLGAANCKGQDDVIALCRNEAVRKSCGECIKRDPRCVWCTDPAFTGDFRCDVESNLVASCAPQFLFQAKSDVKITENAEAGTYEPAHGKVRQIQPQQVHALIKPGENATFQLKYYHVEEEQRDIYILNSETESHGVTLTYSVNCKGEQKHDRQCSGVRNSDLITYTVSISVQGCSSNAVVSIGLSGVREVLALYVHPQCGCECEKPERQEPKSSHCNGLGTLICGSCICDDPRRGGRHCECPLAPGQTTAQLEDSCRSEPHKAVCNDHGYCNCGTCVCDPPNQYSGKFCDCSFASCPISEANGLACGNRGQCNCGTCDCEPGWSGPACGCSTETDECLFEDRICAGKGTCVCNKCKCIEGYEGGRCEHYAGHSPSPVDGPHPGEVEGIPWPDEGDGPLFPPNPSPDEDGTSTEIEHKPDAEPEPGPGLEMEPGSEPEPEPEPESTGGDGDVPNPEASAGENDQSGGNGAPESTAVTRKLLLYHVFAVILLGFVYYRR